jgi:hypothetical protein
LPGTHCFNGGLSIGGNADVTANYVDILITSGNLNVSGVSTLNCDYTLVQVAQNGTGVSFTGNSNVDCTNSTFFLSTGSFNLQGTGSYNFTAPTMGPHQEYANLLFYMPFGNTSNLSITGNASTQITGTIIGISAPVILSGNSGSDGFHTSIAGYTITIVGNPQLTINYFPEEQLTVLDPSAIGLTK